MNKYQSPLDIFIQNLNLDYYQSFKIISDDLYDGMTVLFTK